MSMTERDKKEPGGWNWHGLGQGQDEFEQLRSLHWVSASNSAKQFALQLLPSDPSVSHFQPKTVGSIKALATLD